MNIELDETQLIQLNNAFGDAVRDFFAGIPIFALRADHSATRDKLKVS